MIGSTQSLSTTPDQLRSLVLDYLCHGCYTRTANAFSRDSSIRHLNADGDEIMASGDTEAPTGDTDELKNLLKQVQLRQAIRNHIMIGRVDDAIAMLNTHFPSVLSENQRAQVQPAPPESRNPTTNTIEYLSSTSTEPSHLLLNLRILAFCEACRTVPIDDPASGDGVPQTRDPDYNMDDEDEQQEKLLLKAQKLYAYKNTLPNEQDRITYQKELENVGGLLAYKVPEESPMAKYLSKERREAVADQINRAILRKTGLPLISSLELITRHIHLLWEWAHKSSVKARSGAAVPPRSIKPSLSSESGGGNEIVPTFDLRAFLDSKP